MASYRTSSVDKKAREGELPVRLCNYTDVHYNERISANHGDFMVATASVGEVGNFLLQVGDILITKDSVNRDKIGIPALIDETSDDFVCGYHLGIIRPDSDLDSEYLFRVMQSTSVNQRFLSVASGVTLVGLSNAVVNRLLIPIPPLAEQQAIATFLNQQGDRIEGLSARIDAAIERLQEYRSALIAAAVTGKIDVRDRDAVEMGASRP